MQMLPKVIFVILSLSFSPFCDSTVTAKDGPEGKAVEKDEKNGINTESLLIRENVKTHYNETKMHGNIVGGVLTSLDKYPHAAYLAISCKMPKETKLFGCGSSILNQDILITAAHCLDNCNKQSIIAIATASENKYNGRNNNGKNFLMHPKFDMRTLSFDIALIRVKYKLKLGPRIKRVILMRNPPKIDTVILAGWGLVDEEQHKSSKFLKMTIQQIISSAECKRTIKNMPMGTICAKATNNKTDKLYGYAARGDSGSGLIGSDYILRGIVSYKIPKVANNVIVYTDPCFYFDWIWQSTQQIMCMK